jgi:BMFP domain-containing protein YqiC
MADDAPRPTLDDLARQLADAVPRNLKALGDDLERNFKALLQAGLAKMEAGRSATWRRRPR